MWPSLSAPIRGAALSPPKSVMRRLEAPRSVSGDNPPAGLQPRRFPAPRKIAKGLQPCRVTKGWIAAM
jgi:hypothetical protein